MLIRSLISLCLLAVALAAPTTTSSSTTSSSSTSTKVADSSCTNGPFTRQCWGNGFSIATDYDTKWPVTGKTVSYNLEITNSTISPDGTPRPAFIINGQYPGPTIYANWGDTLSITVKNSLQYNGTSMHWHGIRQANSSVMDGANGVTECPIAPGHSKTYTFLLTQFGTTWYHSHFSGQYGDGVLGPMVIAGPATANYDIDLGAYPFTDWFYKSSTQEYIIDDATGGIPPTADNGLINGTMVNPAGTAGAYGVTTLTKGKKYRLRLINTSVENHFKVQLDGHNFTVIQADFVPIVPYSTNWLFLGIGQRYDVIITANQNVGSYWFRAEQQAAACGANANNLNIKSIFTYAGAPAGNPTTTGVPYTQSCSDETQIVPYVKKDVPSSLFIAQSQHLNVSFQGPNFPGPTSNIVQWQINGQSINVDWDQPTLQYVEQGNNSFPANLNLIKLPNANEYYFWIIQGTGPLAVPHPIHLHGHDFYLLGAGLGTFTAADAANLQYTNPPRRDVAMLPSPINVFPATGGWLVIAFQTDNPGAWLMHCHIAFHVGQGLSVQFLERESEIASVMSLSVLDSTCAAWNSYIATEVYPKGDSGL